MRSTGPEFFTANQKKTPHFHKALGFYGDGAPNLQADNIEQLQCHAFTSDKMWIDYSTSKSLNKTLNLKV